MSTAAPFSVTSIHHLLKLPTADCQTLIPSAQLNMQILLNTDFMLTELKHDLTVKWSSVGSNLVAEVDDSINYLMYVEQQAQLTSATLQFTTIYIFIIYIHIQSLKVTLLARVTVTNEKRSKAKQEFQIFVFWDSKVV